MSSNLISIILSVNKDTYKIYFLSSILLFLTSELRDSLCLAYQSA